MSEWRDAAKETPAVNELGFSKWVLGYDRTAMCPVFMAQYYAPLNKWYDDRDFGNYYSELVVTHWRPMVDLQEGETL